MIGGKRLDLRSAGGFAEECRRIRFATCIQNIPLNDKAARVAAYLKAGFSEADINDLDNDACWREQKRLEAYGLV